MRDLPDEVRVATTVCRPASSSWAAALWCRNKPCGNQRARWSESSGCRPGGSEPNTPSVAGSAGGS